MESCNFQVDIITFIVDFEQYYLQKCLCCFQVLSNPFDDIIPRQQLKCIKKDKEDEMKKVKSQSRATKLV